MLNWERGGGLGTFLAPMKAGVTFIWGLAISWKARTEWIPLNCATNRLAVGSVQQSMYRGSENSKSHAGHYFGPALLEYNRPEWKSAGPENFNKVRKVSRTFGPASWEICRTHSFHVRQVRPVRLFGNLCMYLLGQTIPNRIWFMGIHNEQVSRCWGGALSRSHKPTYKKPAKLRNLSLMTVHRVHRVLTSKGTYQSRGLK